MDYILKTTSGNAYHVSVDTDYNATNPVDYMDTVNMFIDTKFCTIVSVTGFDYMDFKTFNQNLDKIFGREPKKYETLYEMALAQGYLLLPIWGYSHSGYAFAACEENPFDKWDSGCAGFIWVKTDLTDYDGKPTNVRQLLVDAVKDFEAYFNYEIYMVGINQIGHETEGFEWAIGDVIFRDNMEEELTLLVLGEVDETAGSLEDYSREEESKLIHNYKNKVDINSALDSLDVLLDKAVIVRDLDCDSFCNAYVIFSNKSSYCVRRIVEQTKAKWAAENSDDNLLFVIAEALTDAGIKHEIVNLEDSFVKAWI